MKSFLLLMLTVVAVQFGAGTALAEQATLSAKPRQLSLAGKPWTGDFDRMLERRMIRVLVPYSRTLYFVDRGVERGLTAELVRAFEQSINRKYAKQLGKRPLTVYIIPTTRDKLLSGVAEGLGDIAAGNLTVTDERSKLIDFVAPPNRRKMRELIVTGPNSPEIETLEDLSGQTIHVRKSTSYYESVLALNARLIHAGKLPAKIVELSDALEDEDKLELLNAGLLDFIVVDDWKAEMWAQILPNVKVREDLVLRSDAESGWAVRKQSPQLVSALTEAYNSYIKVRGKPEQRLVSYQRRIKQIGNNASGPEWVRFEQTIALFKKYGNRYGFDPLMLAAQGFQESGLKQDARSDVGAIGVMQIMPSTGKDLGVGDISQVEPNIHGGAKYMDTLMTKYFPDAKFSEAVRPLFAFASYNAGPGNISKMRKEAARRGLDPDKWFNNVEIVVSEKIGAETTTYVRNIYKYYTAYKLTVAMDEARRKAREEVAPINK